MSACAMVLSGFADSAAAQPARHGGRRLSELMPVMNQLREIMRFFLQRFSVERVSAGDVVQLFNRVIGQLQASAGYILSQMLNR